MPSFSVKIRSRNEVAEGTMAFHFEKPTGFTFVPGQWARFTLENPPETDAEGNARPFSLASAPHENQLMIVTRMRDTAFKRVLKGMPIGASVRMQGPFGTLTLPPVGPEPVVFLTGGIGITPFLSMIKDATITHSAQKMVLFYSNRRPENTAFLQELQGMEKKNPHFTLVGTMTQMENSTQPWSGERGYITEEMLRKFVPNIAAAQYFIAGPPAMVETLAAMLRHANVSEDRIHVEEFSGY